ncbi:hypothetical protein ACSNOH_24655 [Streptomyces sp. URMC 127]|uniref:hypothetical protein n=1 Tax=Streptomyces sp. URMC 127 TaxID=3423402 RepID=UPI003F19B74D
MHRLLERPEGREIELMAVYRISRLSLASPAAEHLLGQGTNTLPYLGRRKAECVTLCGSRNAPGPVLQGRIPRAQ